MIIKVTSLEEKLHSESYWISKKNIDFSNSKGFSFTIPENSVFDIASRYIQGLKIYEISIRYYKFSNEFTINGTPDMTISPVAVFSRSEYRLDEKSLEDFINTLSSSAENMNKALFESKLYDHQEVRNYANVNM